MQVVNQTKLYFLSDLVMLSVVDWRSPGAGRRSLVFTRSRRRVVTIRSWCRRITWLARRWSTWSRRWWILSWARVRGRRSLWSIADRRRWSRVRSSCCRVTGGIVLEQC